MKKGSGSYTRHKQGSSNARSNFALKEQIGGTPDVANVLEQWTAAGGHGARFTVQVGMSAGREASFPFQGARIAGAMLETLKLWWPAAYNKYINGAYYVRQVDVIAGQTGVADVNALAQCLGTVYCHINGQWKGDAAATKQFLLDWMAAYCDQMGSKLTESTTATVYEKGLASLRQALAKVPSWRNEGNETEWLPFLPPVTLPRDAQNFAEVDSWLTRIARSLWNATSTLRAVVTEYPELTNALARYGIGRLTGGGNVLTLPAGQPPAAYQLPAPTPTPPGLGGLANTAGVPASTFPANGGPVQPTANNPTPLAGASGGQLLEAAGRAYGVPGLGTTQPPGGR